MVDEWLIVSAGMVANARRLGINRYQTAGLWTIGLPRRLYNFAEGIGKDIQVAF